MSRYRWYEMIEGSEAKVDGPTLTTAARASCIPTSSIVTLGNNFWQPGRKMRIEASGRISCVVTTPGTARFDIQIGSVIAFDTGALNLNIVAKVTVPWFLEIDLTCRSEGTGTLATLIGSARFQSEAVIGSPLPTVGGNGSLCVPVGAPVVGTGFDSTLANTLNMFFTQTVATGSMTVHQYHACALN